MEGLFIRLRHAIETVGARRVVLDTIETLFSGFANEGLLRSEIRRLFQFLKSFGVTAIVTGERGEKSLTRFGLEEYVADCVILLDHRITDQVYHPSPARNQVSRQHARIQRISVSYR